MSWRGSVLEVRRIIEGIVSEARLLGLSGLIFGVSGC